jgi:menaquinone-dependent protoporphyrinogen oxidase
VSPSILVAYATRYGSTQEVAEAIADALRENGFEVDLRFAREVREIEKYGGIVLGAPLFMLRWHKDAHRFLSRHRAALGDRPVAVFALGPVHEPHDEQEWQNSQDQLDNALAKHPWFKPASLKLFGGKYDPSKLGFMIKMLAGDAPASDLRDWEEIRAWAVGLKSILS